MGYEFIHATFNTQYVGYGDKGILCAQNVSFVLWIGEHMIITFNMQYIQIRDSVA